MKLGGRAVAINGKYKSMFIFPAVGVATILLLLSITQVIIDDDQRIAWIGATIAALPLPVLIIWLMRTGVPRTSEHLPILMFVAGSGLAVAVWQQNSLWQDFEIYWAGWFPTGVAIAAVLIFVVYVYWYSRFGRIASGTLSVGNKLPEFELIDSDGAPFQSQSLLGAPAVILFYRGNWCPFCVAQIAEMVARYKDLKALGINVVLISPQTDEASRKLSAKYDVPFKYLIDNGNALAEKLSIAVNNGVPVGISSEYPRDTVLPTLILTNASGTIIFSDQTDNYRVRPEPDVYLSILRRAGAISR